MRRKKGTVLVISMILFLGNIAYADWEQPEPVISNDGKEIHMDTEPQIVRNVVYVPVRFFEQELGADVVWDKPTIRISKNNIKMTCTLDSSIYMKDDEQFSIQDVPYIDNNRVYVPVRVISEQLGCDVYFDESGKKVDVKLIEGPYKPKPFPVDDDTKYSWSPDGNWGVKDERYYSVEDGIVVFVKNNQTKEIRKIFAADTSSRYEWMKDNRLILLGDDAPPWWRRILMIYDPKTNHFEKFVQCGYYSYVNYLDVVVTESNMREQKVNIIVNTKLIDLKTNKIQTIDLKEYYIYRDSAYDNNGHGYVFDEIIPIPEKMLPETVVIYDDAMRIRVIKVGTEHSSKKGWIASENFGSEIKPLTMVVYGYNGKPYKMLDITEENMKRYAPESLKILEEVLAKKETVE